MRRLRDAALDAWARMGARFRSGAYGDIASPGRRRAKAGGVLDIIDALPIQIENLREKLGPSPARTSVMDASALDFRRETFDRAILFFLLHEQPRDVRLKTVAEALRVLKPGGRLVIVDYARPERRHPLSWLMRPALATLEPFALDLWREEIGALLPQPWAGGPLSRQTFFGGLYQLVTIAR